MSIFTAIMNRKNDKKREREYTNFVLNNYKKMEEGREKDKKRIQNLNSKLREVQQSIAVELDTASNIETTTYTGNAYQNYDKAAEAIVKKYGCEDDWGCLLTGVIIDMRSALIQGGDIEIVEKKDKDKKEEATEQERAWVQEFVEYNKLNDYQVFDSIKGTEMEARLLFKLEYDKDYEWNNGDQSRTGMVALIPYLYTDKKYKVEVDKFKKPAKIVFESQEGSKTESFTDESEFVYRKFGGKINAYNNPVMKMWRALTQVENVDKAIRNLRKINNIFSSPKPYIVVKEGEVDDTTDNVNENWKTGILLVLTGEMKYLQVSVQYVEVLVKEVYINVQMIGAATGLPVHWLSLVDLMSNRSTAEDLGDITEMAVSTERKIFFDGLNEGLDKAIDMQNKKSEYTKIRKGIFSLKPNIISDEQWKHLKDIFLDLVKNDKFSLLEFYKLIPGINAEEAYSAFVEEIKQDFENKYMISALPPGNEDNENGEAEKEE